MRRRFLNIASALCLVACVALVVLWVRSYHAKYEWHTQLADRRVVFVSSLHGQLALSRSLMDATPSNHLKVWEYENGPHDWYWKMGNSRLQEQTHSDVTYLKRVSTHLGFAGQLSYTDSFLLVPYWFLVLLTGTVAAAPRIRWRFSLRTLLLATALVAAVLGLIAWLDKSWIGK